MRFLLDWTPADWLSPHALVVGYVTVRMDGVAFRSIIPNPDRNFVVPIENITATSIGATSTQEPRAIELHLKAGPNLIFLVDDPRSCRLAVDQAIAVCAARTAYR